MATIKEIREFCAKTFPRYKISQEGQIMRWQDRDVSFENKSGEVVVFEKGWHFVGWLNLAQCLGASSILGNIPKKFCVERTPGVFAQ